MPISGAFSTAPAAAAGGGLQVDKYENPDPADVDAFKTSIATSTSPQTYSGAALNGVVGAASLTYPRELSVTTTAAVGAYTTASPIVFTYEDWAGQERTVNVSLTATNGNETKLSGRYIKRLISIAVPAMLAGTGTLRFGFGDGIGFLAEPDVEAGNGFPLVVGFWTAGTEDHVLGLTPATPTASPPYGGFLPTTPPDGSTSYTAVYVPA